MVQEEEIPNLLNPNIDTEKGKMGSKQPLGNLKKDPIWEFFNLQKTNEGLHIRICMWLGLRKVTLSICKILPHFETYINAVTSCLSMIF